MYGVSAVAAGVWPFLFFPMSRAAAGRLTLGVVGALVIHSLMYGPQAAFIAEQFSPRLRYTGSSLAYTLAGVIGGAVAPLLFTALLGTYDAWQPLALYIGVAMLVTLVGLAMGQRRARRRRRGTRQGGGRALSGAARASVGAMSTDESDEPTAQPAAAGGRRLVRQLRLQHVGGTAGRLHRGRRPARRQPGQPGCHGTPRRPDAACRSTCPGALYFAGRLAAVGRRSRVLRPRRTTRHGGPTAARAYLDHRGAVRRHRRPGDVPRPAGG